MLMLGSIHYKLKTAVALGGGGDMQGAAEGQLPFILLVVTVLHCSEFNAKEILGKY